MVKNPQNHCLNKHMEFKQWFFEFGDITKTDASNVALTPGDSEEFDATLASDQCEEELNHLNNEFDEWRRNNREPKFTNYAHLPDADEEFESAHDEWVKNTEEFHSKIQAAMDQCVESKKDLHNQLDLRTWTSNFNQNNSDFEVEFKPISPITIGKTTLHKVYDVTFTGPKGVSLTNAGVGQNAIYTQLMLSVKKFLESVPVEVLYFTGADDAMNLVYDRFYKRYLSKAFVRYDFGHYINRQVFQDILNKSTPEEKKEIFSNMIDFNRDRVKSNMNTKKEKFLVRDTRKAFPIGKLVGVEWTPGKKEPAVVYNVENYLSHLGVPRIELLYLYLNGAINTRTVLSTYIRDISEVPKQEVDKFMQTLKNSSKTPWLPSNIQALIQNYHI